MSRQVKNQTGSVKNKSPEAKIINATVALADCIAHARNYNRHPDSQIADIAESLQTFGQVKPIVVHARGDGKYDTIAGHGVALGARKLGWERIEARIIPATWSKTKALAYLAADNELARRGDPDQAQLAQIVADIAKAEGEALAKLAAGDADALAALMAQADPVEETADAGELIDRAEELQKKWRVSRGDLWQCGKHRILCGDSTNADDVARLFGDSVARMMWTDPPYGVKYGEKMDATNPITHRVRSVKNDDLSDDQLEELIRSAIKNFCNHSVKGAVAYVASPAGTPLPTFIKSFVGSGVDFRWHLVWLKDRIVLSRADYHFKHENILYGWKPDGAHYFIDDRRQSSVFEYPRPKRSEEHPTMKPPEIVAHMLNNSSVFGEVVYDAFDGSGTTLVACEQTGRIGRGIELEPKYVAVALERLSPLGLDCKRIEPDTVNSNGKATRKRKRKAK